MNHVTPRGLTADRINNLISVRGIVTRMSLVRPKLTESVHYCDHTKVGHVREFYDDHDLAKEEKITLGAAFPLKDHDGNSLSCEFGYCTFKDIQTCVLQEMPEKSPTGQLPRSI